MEDKKLNAGRVGLTMKGAWNASQSYEKLNCVSHNGRSWAAKKNVSAGVEPSAANSEFWQMMSDRGEQGIQGPVGPQGNSAYVKDGVVNKFELVNNLTQGGETAALSAEQGKILKTELTELETEVEFIGQGLKMSEEMLKQGAPTYSESITVSTKGNIKVLPSRKYKFDNVDDILIAVYETKESGAVELMKWMEAINEYTTSSNAVAVQFGFRKSDLSDITPASIAAIGITMRDEDAITILREEINSSDERIIELEKRSDFLGNGYPLMLEMLKQGMPTYPDANSVHTIPIDVKASRKYIFNNVHNLLVSVYEVDSAGNSTIKVWKQEINDYDTTDSANAVIMAFTSKAASALTPNAVYEMGISIQDASANSILKEEIGEIHDNITTSPYVIEEYPACWVRAEDGAIISATDIHYAVKYSVDGLKMVRVKGMWYGSNVAAIAFFNKEGTYLPQYTINAINTEVITTLESAVPSEASYALSCSSRSFLPIVETNEVGRTLNAMSKSLSGSMGFCKKSIMSGVTKSEVYPISHCVDYHHLFIDKIYEGSQVTIPCQSLFDVAVAASLGFKMIEANVLLTSDGVAVTGHSIGGSVLQTLTDLNGNEVDVDVSAITFADLRANYRYKSVFSQYRTPITSLEEFLIECKRYNLTPFVQCVSDSVIALVESIVGKRYVAYNATRKQTDVTIYEYKRGTIDELVARCKDVGAPYILGVHAENLNAFTDAEIQDLLTKVHAEGCWLGWAGCYHSVEESLRFRRLGLDFSGSGWDVPDFSEGNEVKAIGNSIVGFSAFKGGYVESDDKALLNKEKDIQLYLEQKSIISKASLHIHFKGDIGITFGKINDRIISDGLKGITLTSVIENSSPELYIYAYNDAEIYSINYVVDSIL